MEEVDRKVVEKVVDHLVTLEGKPVSPQTRRNYLTKLKQLFNWCVAEQVIAINPAATLSVSVDATVPEAYTIHQCRRLLEVVQLPEFQPLIGVVTLGLFAGLRPKGPPGD